VEQEQEKEKEVVKEEILVEKTLKSLTSQSLSVGIAYESSYAVLVSLELDLCVTQE